MTLAIIAVLVGLALGVGVVLILLRPGSLRSPQRRATRREAAPLKSEVTPSKPVASAAPVGPSHDQPTRVDRPIDFPEAVVKAAWRRQGGLCAECGRLLIWTNRDRDSGIGAWQSHHRIPRDQGGSSDLKNCVLFCSGVANCHFNVGHGGIGRNHYSRLEDASLLYLRYGADKANTTAPQARAKPGVIEAVFGQRRSTSKPSKRSRPSLPLLDDYDGAYGGPPS